MNLSPDFIPPKSFREYLIRCSERRKGGCGRAAKELGIAMLDASLDDRAKEIVLIFRRGTDGRLARAM